MHDALLVRRLQRLRDLARDRERLVQRHRPARDPLRQRLALDELEHQRTDAARLLDAVDVRDAVVVERCQDLGLSVEPRHPIGIRREATGRIFTATSRPSRVSLAR